jgi:hypothetical protein
MQVKVATSQSGSRERRRKIDGLEIDPKIDLQPSGSSGRAAALTRESKSLGEGELIMSGQELAAIGPMVGAKQHRHACVGGGGGDHTGSLTLSRLGAPVGLIQSAARLARPFPSLSPSLSPPGACVTNTIGRGGGGGGGRLRPALRQRGIGFGCGGRALFAVCL